MGLFSNTRTKGYEAVGGRHYTRIPPANNYSAGESARYPKAQINTQASSSRHVVLRERTKSNYRVCRSTFFKRNWFPINAFVGSSLIWNSTRFNIGIVYNHSRLQKNTLPQLLFLLIEDLRLGVKLKTIQTSIIFTWSGNWLRRCAIMGFKGCGIRDGIIIF